MHLDKTTPLSAIDFKLAVYKDSKQSLRERKMAESERRDREIKRNGDRRG